MKKLLTILSAVFLTATLGAQSPEKMSYQAVVRNDAGQLVTNTQIGMQISILQGTYEGTVVYSEVQTPTTNANGLVSIEIGTGTTSDDFSTIDWADGPYFIKTKTDPTQAGGTNYTITGVSQLLSVPYALHSKTAETATETDPVFTSWDKDYDNLTNKPDLSVFATKDMAFQNITNLADPLNDKDAATKFYVDILRLEIDSMQTLITALGAIMDTLTRRIEGLLPVVTTDEVTHILSLSAKCGGKISNPDNITIYERGVVFSLNENPSIDFNIGITSDGAGDGNFSSHLTGLTANTTFYVRAYAICSMGEVYGNQLEFTTLEVPEMGSYTDPRDGNTYPTVVIGKQEWMASNLKYLPFVNRKSFCSDEIPYYYVYNYDGTDTTEAKASANYLKYGVLYNWPAAKIACPEGWYLPRDWEWRELTDYLGGADIAGGKLKETGTINWNIPNTGATNETGFIALPGGFLDTNPYGGSSFLGIGNKGYWWSASKFAQMGEIYAYTREMSYNDSGVIKAAYGNYNGLSVRCLKGSPHPHLYLNANPVYGGTITGAGQHPPGTEVYITAQAEPGFSLFNWTDPAYSYVYDTSSSYTITMPTKNITINANFIGSFTDSRDGNMYKTINIGNQEWMAENLKFLPSVVGPDSSSSVIPLYYVYNYGGTDITEAKAEEGYNLYGVLYNWPAAMDGAAGSVENPSGVKGVCPDGWHLPSEEEWNQLILFVGGYNQFATCRLKEERYGHWHWQFSYCDDNPKNASGFTALPGGLMANDFFFDINYYGYWWSATGNATSSVSYKMDDVEINKPYGITSSSGLSVRCVKD